MIPRGVGSALSLAFSLFQNACAAPTLRSDQPRAAAATAAIAAESEPRSFSGGFEHLLVTAQGLRLRVPDRPAWRVVNSGTWSLLIHDRTHSSLLLKLWSAPRLVRKEECAAMARLGRRDLALLEEEELVERRPFSAPAGFDAELRVGVREAGGELHGFAQVFGAGIGRCYVAAFETVARGPVREKEIGRRLGLFVEAVLASVEVRNIEQRVSD
ncbi:MAG TPA: hypothetical protein VGP93_01900 [Polyangiaceae bacterium]|nr:hypothetical protein [Polyangiaceae bacterium]